jgi:Fe-S cluster biosynthesis and repair protein YggX
MKKINKKRLGVLGLGLGLGALTLGGFGYSAGAFQGDYSQKGPNCNPERHEMMEKVFENNDYQAWKNLMEGRGRVTEIINEESFSKFAEAHRLALEGKIDEAKVIREELGLGKNRGEGRGMRHSKRTGMSQQ